MKELTVLQSYGLSFKAPEAFDHQVTGTFQECERMAYYKHFLGREPNSGDRTALSWGKAVHGASEVWEVTKDPEAVFTYLDSVLEENLEDRYGRTKARLFEAFQEYAAFQERNPIEVLRTEQPTYISCVSGESCPYFDDGCGLEYGGRIDRVVRWQGLIGPLDIKTTVMNDQDPVAEYRPSHQFMGYLWAVGHLMNAHPWGIIVDRIVTNKSSINIRRFPVSFSKDNIREWVETERRVHRRIKHLADNHPYEELEWTQNYFRCQKPYPCAFREVCLSPRDGGFRYKWLAQHTTERRWDFRDPDNQETEPNG